MKILFFLERNHRIDEFVPFQKGGVFVFIRRKDPTQYTFEELNHSKSGRITSANS